jgi:PIN domain nuclease of toxin-antitoxin system
VVLDATAILAVLFNEMGSDVLMPLLEGALVSAVNLAEVHAVLVRRGVDADVAWRQLEGLGCAVSPMDAEQARIAGGLVRSTSTYRLSLGDRACLALAIQRKATAYTTNAAWKNLAPGIHVEVLR